MSLSFPVCNMGLVIKEWVPLPHGTATPPFLTSAAPPIRLPEGGFSILRGCRQGSNLSGAPGGACFPTTPHCKPVLLHPLLYAQAPHSCLWQWPLPHPRMSSGSLPCSSTHTLPDSQPKHMWLFLHLRTSSQSAARVQGLPFPPSSASGPTSPPHPLLSSFSQPHSFPQTPTPCPATSGCFLCPKATQQPSVQPPSPGIPERAPSQLTLLRGHCCSGIRLPQ